jgi:hypothetical protein
MRSVIYIDKEGNLSGLSDNLFDKLAALGRRAVQRVSNIEFNPRIQKWQAVDLDGNIIGVHEFRDKLIEIERDYLNTKIEEDYGKNQNLLS